LAGALPVPESYDFRLGDLYAVFVLSRPLRSLEEMDHPLARITFSNANYVQIRDKQLEVIGAFDTLGQAID